MFTTPDNQIKLSFYCRTDVFKNSFFPYVIVEWIKLKPELKNVEPYLKFRKLIINLDNRHPIFNPIYNIFNHLNEHKFKHNFPESNSHFFLRCHHYTILHADLMNDLKITDENILRFSENSLVQLLLFGGPKYNIKLTTSIY